MCLTVVYSVLNDVVMYCGSSKRATVKHWNTSYSADENNFKIEIQIKPVIDK